MLCPTSIVIRVFTNSEFVSGAYHWRCNTMNLPRLSFRTLLSLVSILLAIKSVAIAGEQTKPAISHLPKNKVIATINLNAAGSSGIAVDPNGQYVYLGANGVAVVSTATNSVVTTIELPNGYGAINLAISPDGSTLYAESNTYFAINTSTWSVVQTLPIQYPQNSYMTMSPDGTKLYCVNNVNASSVSAFNSGTGAILWTADLGDYPVPASGAGANVIASSPDGNYIYVLNEGSGTKTVTGYVSVVQASTGTVVVPKLKFEKGRAPVSLAMSPDGSTLYAGEDGSFDVQFIDTATNTRKQQIVIDTQGFHVDALAVTPDGKYLYVSTSTNGPGNVYMVDLARNKVVGLATPVGD